MPITPYHFGPSAFVGLTLRKWLDIPVFVLANVIVDIEVLVIGLLGLGWPTHRYSHTLLIGAVVGAIWGIAAYPLRHFFEKIMQVLRIPYQTSSWKMVVSGVLGVWLHVVIDAIYHWDVRIFWPSKAKPLYGLISQGQVKAICVAFFFAALILYTTAVLSYVKQNKARKTIQKNELTPYS
jgi:membrane-bound metal-dependent hydrolase YbcI (DUF457 family)